MAIQNIMLDSLNENNAKPFWKYIRSQKLDNIIVAPLKDNGIIHSNSKDKAQILNKQFQSLFTDEEKSNIPTMSGNPTPSIGNLHITSAGVEKLLQRLQPNKAAGPDNIPCHVLKELSADLAPMLAAVFNQSLSTGTIPDD